MKNKRIQLAICIFAGLLLGLATLIAGQNPPQTRPPAQNPPQTPPPNPNDPQYRLNVEVELVNVTATVVDNSGRYLEGLAANDFTVLEDGVPQKVAFFSHDRRVPVSLGILIDTSGSMRYKLVQALETAREIVAALGANDEAFVMTFDSEVKLRQAFTRDPEEIRKALRDIRAGGETAAFDAIATGIRQLRTGKNDKKILLSVTDGFDTKSGIDSRGVEEILKRAPVLLYAIGIDDDDADPSTARRARYHIYHYMLNRLTSLTGGRAYRLFSSRNYALNSLAEALLEELHQQYTLSYYPTSSRPDGGWRELEIRIDRPGSIRHRTGYYIGSTK